MKRNTYANYDEEPQTHDNQKCWKITLFFNNNKLNLCGIEQWKQNHIK